jgi:hypothetical protein
LLFSSIYFLFRIFNGLDAFRMQASAATERAET